MRGVLEASPSKHVNFVLVAIIRRTITDKMLRLVSQHALIS